LSQFEHAIDVRPGQKILQRNILSFTGFSERTASARQTVLVVDQHQKVIDFKMTLIYSCLIT